MGFVIHWHESAMELHVFPIPIPPPTSLSTQSLWVFPVHQARALVSCIQPGLVICFTLDNIHAVLLKHPTLTFSADGWIRKLWYIYTMEYYSAVKKNSFKSVLMRWMKLEPIIQSEVSQKDKEHYIYMEFRKMVMITLYAKQKKRHRYTLLFLKQWRK